MSKRVVIAIDFDYDRDHSNDLMDVIQITQVSSELSHDEAHEQAVFLFQDKDWLKVFGESCTMALTGSPTHFGSEEN